jgi:hypothetical protein
MKDVIKLQTVPSRALEIANLYHQQSMDLINLALLHSKQLIESSHKRAGELLQVKDSKLVPDLVSNHINSQVREYLSFASTAYQMGFDAHAQVLNAFHQQIDDNYLLVDEALKSPALSGNPISTMTMTMVKGALEGTKTAINSAKSSAAKTAADLAKSAASVNKG